MYQTTLPSQGGLPLIVSISVKPSPSLLDFLSEICKGDLGDAGSEWFGPLARMKIMEKANIIEAFSKALLLPSLHTECVIQPIVVFLVCLFVCLFVCFYPSAWSSSMGVEQTEPGSHTTIRSEANSPFPEAGKNRKSSGAIPFPRNRDISNKASRWSPEAPFTGLVLTILGFCKQFRVADWNS